MNILVQISKETANLDAVVEALRAHGMEVEKVMKVLRVVSGKIEDPKIDEISSLEGVTSVREEGEMKALPHKMGP